MEYLWYIIASIGAGVGTGLAGLSAATVMVPILIVLCPSFQGQEGVYQATAIALASDILGSAVTTYTYAKHKNIDLKRGWIMLVCILAMCTVGSYVAFLAGNVVLGGFTLILTFCIGIRFLVKPDTASNVQAEKGQKLDLKGIAISVFFGLTIGFGTGFVGTGGGMMMLIVFTMFLGMELKSTVGTSTFIMTFTALIASVSHILIYPAIVLEKWHVLLLCMAVATAASLISARFANRVDSRIVGLITGAVLTVLGAFMIVLNYWDYISRFELIAGALRCIGMLALYIIPCLLILVPVRILTKLPSYVFRKLLHVVAFTCITIMLLGANNWKEPALASVIIAGALYPVLMLIEKEPWYPDLFVEKEPGEIKKSLILLFSMFAFLTFLCWGIFHQRGVLAASILMWGTGDAAAALVGIPYGKHKVHMKYTDGKKSWEGSLAMLAVSFVSGMVILLYIQKLSFLQAVLASVTAGVFGTFTELVSGSQYDTVTVPIVMSAVLLMIAVFLA